MDLLDCGLKALRFEGNLLTWSNNKENAHLALGRPLCGLPILDIHFSIYGSLITFPVCVQIHGCYQTVLAIFFGTFGS